LLFNLLIEFKMPGRRGRRGEERGEGRGGRGGRGEDERIN
jgi:hypothetical protein